MGELETADRGSTEALFGNAVMKSATSAWRPLLNFRSRPEADIHTCVDLCRQSASAGFYDGEARRPSQPSRKRGVAIALTASGVDHTMFSPSSRFMLSATDTADDLSLTSKVMVRYDDWHSRSAIRRNGVAIAG